jgi:hypothetical protein
MRKLGKPTDNPIEVFDLCISIVRDGRLKQKFEACKDSILLALDEYNLKATTTELHTIKPHDNINNSITKDEMIYNYTGRMAVKEKPARRIYDKLISSSPHNKCPLCAHRTVDTLDHHLPKTHFPIYSVAPINLFPACTPCNKLKLSFFATTQNEEPIHPYFDNVEDDLWLYAEVVQLSPPSLKFFTRKPDNWSLIKYQRIENHFNLLELEKLYASNSGTELTQIEYYVNKLFNSGGENSVKEYLIGIYESSNKANLNSWQTAFYLALINSNGYLNGGFKN